ncbi:MAG: metal ABC transporter permease, partial [Hyphomicrobiales bacterium]|nr:metal ABC transporter permease [Hyphomicrobiales bacterium]
MEDEAKSRLRADEGTTLSAIRGLWPYIWPADRPDLKRRVALAFVALFIAKVVTVLVPYVYKWSTDALVPETAGGELPFTALLAAPLMLVVAYGIGRVMMIGFNELRNALFAKVGQHAVRQLAYRTFIHMHDLSLRFHLMRRTGGLSRVIERGTKGIEIIVRFAIMMTIPTIL